jgi:hypothetical protein
MTSLNLTADSANMSIYAGFPTRRHETFYNRLLFKAIELLCAQLSHHVSEEQNATAIKPWANKIYKLVRFLSAMESQKHLEPNFSQAFSDIFIVINKRFGFTDRKTNTFETVSDTKLSYIESDL